MERKAEYSKRSKNTEMERRVKKLVSGSSLEENRSKIKTMLTN